PDRAAIVATPASPLHVHPRDAHRDGTAERARLLGRRGRRCDRRTRDQDPLRGATDGRVLPPGLPGIPPEGPPAHPRTGQAAPSGGLMGPRAVRAGPVTTSAVDEEATDIAASLDAIGKVMRRSAWDEARTLPVA